MLWQIDFPRKFEMQPIPGLSERCLQCSPLYVAMHVVRKHKVHEQIGIAIIRALCFLKLSLITLLK